MTSGSMVNFLTAGIKEAYERNLELETDSVVIVNKTLFESRDFFKKIMDKKKIANAIMRVVDSINFRVEFHINGEIINKDIINDNGKIVIKDVE